MTQPVVAVENTDTEYFLPMIWNSQIQTTVDKTNIV